MVILKHHSLAAHLLVQATSLLGLLVVTALQALT
jgi:hypothetical protein